MAAANLIPAPHLAARGGHRQPGSRRPGRGRGQQPLRPDQRALGRRRGSQHPARHARRHRSGWRHPGRGRACRRGDRRAAQPVDVQTTVAASDSVKGGESNRLASLRRGLPPAGRCTAARHPDLALLPLLLLLPARRGDRADARLSARPARHDVVPGVRAAPAVRDAGAVGRPRQLPRDPRRLRTSGPSCSAPSSSASSTWR